MEGNLKPKKGFRITSPFRREKVSPSPTSSDQTVPSRTDQEPSGQHTESADTQRTRNRYNDAVKFLQDAIEARGGEQWPGLLRSSSLGDQKEDLQASQLREQIDEAIKVFNFSVKDQDALGKCRHIIQCMFTALSPLAKNVLTIASTASNIPVLNPYGLVCSGLLLFIKIADKEVSRKTELSKTLDFMSQQLEQIEIIDILPTDIDKYESVVNRGLDIRSACMIYLGIQIRHDATPLGSVGKVIKTFIVGDEKISDSKIYLQNSIENYTRALSTFNTGAIIKVLEVVKEVAVSVRSPPQHDKQYHPEDKFIVPFQRNPQFTGRSKLLQELKATLSTVAPKKFNHRVALYGMGGVGKTQCAIEYVYASASDYERIYWITAVDQASILSGYQKIAKAAAFPNSQDSSPSDIAEAVISWLKRQQNWLLVFDNLDDIEVIKGLLPENDLNKHTLITTRNPHTRGIPAEPLQVPLFDMEESIELLSTLSDIAILPDSEERKHAETIIKELEYLPLAIEQAASYVREVTRNFGAYCEEYARNRRELLQWTSEGNRMYSYSVATTWSMAFKIIRNTHTQAAELLRLFSLLNPDGILIEFLESGANAFGDDLKETILDQIKRAKAFLVFEKFSLIKWDREKQVIFIHRLIQMILRDEMSETERTLLCSAIIDLCDRTFPMIVTNETRPICRKYQDQILGPLLQIKVTPTKKYAMINDRIGYFLKFDGKPYDSERVLQQAVDAWKTVSGMDDYNTLRAMNSLALTYQDQGRNLDALEVQEEVLKRNGRIFGDEHPDTLITMHNLALTFRALGRNADARKIQEEVLEKEKKILGEENPLTLSTMDDLATTYDEQGRNTDSEKIREEVLEKRRRIMGEEHPDTLITMHNLALTYRMQRRYADARKIQEEVLEKRKRLFGEVHPYTLDTMDGLALTYHALGRYTEAAKIQEEVLEMKKRILGEEHPNILITMGNLALTYQNQGRTLDALEIQEEALTKRRRIFGDEHPDTLLTMNNLALTFGALGRNADAGKIQEEVLEKRKKISGEEHPLTLCTMDDLATTYMEQGRNTDSEKIREDVLEKRRRILGEEHPDTLITKHNLAGLYHRRGRNADARKIQEEVLEKRKRILGEEHPFTLGTMYCLALTYQALGRNKEAEKTQEEVLEKRKRLLGEEHPDTLTTMQSLVRIYRAQGRNADAAKIEEEVQERESRIKERMAADRRHYTNQRQRLAVKTEARDTVKSDWTKMTTEA